MVSMCFSTATVVRLLIRQMDRTLLLTCHGIFDSSRRTDDERCIPSQSSYAERAKREMRRPYQSHRLFPYRNGVLLYPSCRQALSHHTAIMSQRISLTSSLAVEPIFVSPSNQIQHYQSTSLWLPHGARGVFGGQVIGQALVAAGKTVKGKLGLHSQHVSLDSSHWSIAD
jgi:hypothetical protein